MRKWSKVILKVILPDGKVIKCSNSAEASSTAQQFGGKVLKVVKK